MNVPERGGLSRTGRSRQDNETIIQLPGLSDFPHDRVGKQLRYFRHLPYGLTASCYWNCSVSIELCRFCNGMVSHAFFHK